MALFNKPFEEIKTITAKALGVEWITENKPNMESPDPDDHVFRLESAPNPRYFSIYGPEGVPEYISAYIDAFGSVVRVNLETLQMRDEHFSPITDFDYIKEVEQEFHMRVIEPLNTAGAKFGFRMPSDIASEEIKELANRPDIKTNTQRERLPDREQGKALHKIQEMGGYTELQLAQITGLEIEQITQLLKEYKNQ